MTLEQFSFRTPLLQLAALLGTGILVAFLVLHYLSPTGSYWSYLVIIPVFFELMGYMLLHVLRNNLGRDGKQLVNIYLMMRIAKILCTVILIMVYIFLVKVHLHFFLPTVLVFYLLHLIWETRFHFTYEGKIKKTREDEKTTE